MGLDLIARHETAKALRVLADMVMMTNKVEYEPDDHKRWEAMRAELAKIIEELAK